MNKKFNANEFITKYRSSNFNTKVKLISRLNNNDKEKVLKLFTKEEIKEYKIKGSALIERRFDCVRRNKKCLDLLISKNPNLYEIKNKYYNVDLSIPVYTIKAIINTYEGIGMNITKDDGVFSVNAKTYYKICRRYWDIIACRWDTHTGVYSKEQIKEKDFSKYHTNANKVRIIFPQLKYKLKSSEYSVINEDAFKKSERFSDYDRWYHTDEFGNKSRVSGPKMFKEFCDRLRVKNEKLFTYIDINNKKFKNLNKENYDFLVERDKSLKNTHISKKSG